MSGEMAFICAMALATAVLAAVWRGLDFAQGHWRDPFYLGVTVGAGYAIVLLLCLRLIGIRLGWEP